MLLRVPSFLLFLLFVFSCNNAEDANNLQDDNKEAQTSEITAKKIEGLQYLDYALSTEAIAEVIDWPMFQELQTQMNYLKQADLSFFTSERKVLDSLMLDLRIQTPEKLKTKPILARINVVKTKILKLHSNLILDNVATEVKIESIRELLQSTSNLNLQINKKLEFDTFNKISAD